MAHVLREVCFDMLILGVGRGQSGRVWRRRDVSRDLAGGNGPTVGGAVSAWGYREAVLTAVRLCQR